MVDFGWAHFAQKLENVLIEELLKHSKYKNLA